MTSFIQIRWEHLSSGQGYLACCRAASISKIETEMWVMLNASLYMPALRGAQCPVHCRPGCRCGRVLVVGRRCATKDIAGFDVDADRVVVADGLRAWSAARPRCRLSSASGE